MTLRIGIALLGITLFSWLVSYYASKQQSSAEDLSTTTPNILMSSFLLGQSADQPGYEGLGHEDGGGDEDGE